ncbi:MAG: homoserine dehydrogenase [Promethearchaeota archaeon CR_4]|nr:MAG: homoserine dehydrogenase [Candidatus Lokiarchaeota archaeon CR_4]
MVNLSLIGYGTVGKDVVRSVASKGVLFGEKIQKKLVFTEIYENDGAVTNPKGINLESLVADGNLRQHPDWKPGIKTLDHIVRGAGQIIIEATPTNPNTGEPGLSHVLAAIQAGKHVVSSNKGPFYLQYAKILNLAKEKKVKVRFGATVGSAIPILAAKDTLAGCEVVEIQAIINGTSNFILSRMTTENEPFELALKEAQQLGYAEADPTLDVGGYDAAGKLVILANHLMGWSKTIKDVKIEGITRVTSEGVELAKKKGLLIKQIAFAKDGKLEVGLRLIPQTSPLATMGTLNAIMLRTDVAGDYYFMGRGAGGPEAATGILSDVIYIARDLPG